MGVTAVFQTVYAGSDRIYTVSGSSPTAGGVAVNLTGVSYIEKTANFTTIYTGVRKDNASVTATFNNSALIVERIV